MDPLPIPVPAPPPWPPDYFDTPEVCLEVGLDVTKRDNPALLKATFLEWVSRRYQGQSLVFTDGSLNGRSGGAGVFVPHLNIRRSYGLGCGFSTEAELAAILMALSELEGLPPGGPGTVICSDSLSALLGGGGGDGHTRLPDQAGQIGPPRRPPVGSGLRGGGGERIGGLPGPAGRGGFLQ